jgi:DNA-binding response OmpR family regulator
VIDDDRAVGCLLGARLEEEGHSVVSTLTRDEGLKLMTLFRPDPVLLDIGLPGVSGC